MSTSKTKTYPSQLWDNMQHYMADYNDHMIHIILNFSGLLDNTVFSAALAEAIEIAPILKCRFRLAFPRPVWEEIENFKLSDVLELVSLEDKESLNDKADAFLTGVIDEHNEAQLKVKIYRQKGRDTLAILLNHQTFDGRSTKDWLEILAVLYTNKLKDIDYKLTGYEDGDRSFNQLYRHFTAAERLKLLTRLSYGSKNTEKRGFPYAEKRLGETPRIMRHKMSAGDFAKLKEVAKRNKMTVNDMILSAYSRAMADVIGGEKVPLEVDCILDLRRYMPQNRTEGLTNFVTKIVCVVDNIKTESIFSTIAQVNQTMAYEKNHYPGMGGLPLLRLGYAVFPYKIAKKVVRKKFNNPLVALSNIGILDERALKFGELRLDDALMTGSIKKPPYIQLALTTLRNVITFTVALYGTEQDFENVEKLFLRMDYYFDLIRKA